jgi:hypothetical protein
MRDSAGSEKQNRGGVRIMGSIGRDGQAGVDQTGLTGGMTST